MIARSFGPCQPAWTEQSDVGRYFSQMHQSPFSWGMAQTYQKLEDKKNWGVAERERDRDRERDREKERQTDRERQREREREREREKEKFCIV